MSHIYKASFKIKDLAALEAACNHLGTVEFTRNQTFSWYNGQSSPCEASVVVKNNKEAYQLGVTKEEDGTYALNYDFFGNKGRALQTAVGNNCDKLKQEYTVQVAMKDRRKQGYQVTRKVNANGSVLLIAQ